MEEVAEQVQRSEAATEAIESSVPQRILKFHNWILPDGRVLDEKQYVQAPLGMMPANEFTTMVTKVLNQFVQGEMGMKIGELFRGEVAMPKTFDADTVDKVVEDNLEIIKAVLKLFEISPGIQLDIMALSLGVPRKEREWFKECISEPPHRGGLTLDEGFDIFIVFIKQNVPMLKKLATGKAQELVDVFSLEVLGRDPTVDSTVEEETEETIDSPGGTPSSTSSLDTPASV